ncbi:MAG: alanine racemase [Campylobacterota bacterium]
MAQIKIHTQNFLHNIDLIKDKAGSADKAALVLKDNAYGHGLDIIAPKAAEAGIKHCVVRDLKEAFFVQNLFDTVLLLNPTKVKLPPFMHQAVNSFDQIEQIKPGCSVELKVDCGMHRNGVDTAAVEAALDAIEDNGLVLKGIFTHHKSADMLTSEFYWQQKNFERIKKRYGHLGVRFHSFNSAALFRAQSLEDDIARVGIAAYGYIDYEKGLPKPPLKPVMSLWADRIATMRLKKGQRVGYGGAYRAPAEMTVSTYDAGYADGLFRAHAHDPMPLANGSKVVGKISMDSLSAQGSEQSLCIFDDAATLARHFDTISYDVLVSLKESIQRVQA